MERQKYVAWKSVLWVVTVAIVYFLIARLSLTFMFQPAGIAAFWPPEGIFLSAILLTRSKLRPWIVAALFVTDFTAARLAGIGPGIGIFYSLSLTGDAVLSAWLLIRFVGTPLTFGKVRHVTGFIFLSVFLSNALMSIIAALATTIFVNAPFWTSYKWWFTSDGIGNLIVTPWILSCAWLFKNRWKAVSWKKVAEFALSLVTMFLVNYFIFKNFSQNNTFFLFLNWLTFPFLIWAALRFGTPGASTAMVCLAGIALVWTLSGGVPLFTTGSELMAAMNMQIYLAVLSVSILILAAVVSEGKDSGLALSVSEARYRRLFETAKDGILILDATSGKIVDANPYLLEILGYPFEKMIGKELWEIGLFKNIIASKEAFLELQKQRYVRYEDLPLETKDRRQIDVEFISNVYLVNNEPVIQCNIRDISERKQSQEEIKRLNEELEQRVKERTARLETLGKELSDNQVALMNIVEDLNEKSEQLIHRTAQLEVANKELEAFSYSVSHDLRAPLRAIAGFSSILKQDHYRQLDKDAVELLTDILKNVKRMSQLIDDLLAFSRLSRKEITSGELDMQRLFSETLEEMKPSMVKGELRFSMEKLPAAIGDKSLIKQVATNLLSNAIKFSGTRENPEIFVSGIENDDECTYSVSDNGVGFDMQYAHKLFGVFQRLHGQEEYEGTGVGLAIVQRIINRHGGRVWAEAQQDKGATFYFTLPKAKKIT